MKKLLISAVAIASLASTAAFAQTQPDKPRPNSHRHATAVPMKQDSQYYNYSANDPYTVIYNGRVVGRDPDPNIRAQLLKDPIPEEY